MSKRKQTKAVPTRQPTPRPAVPTVSVGSVPAEAVTRRRAFSWPVVLGVVGVLALLTVGGFFWLYRPNPSGANLALNANRPVGGVTCKESPKYLIDLHYANGSYLSTNERGIKGLALVEATANGQQPRIYQHPSWGNAGYLAPLEWGSKGTLFVAPAPSITVLYNPPDQQNEVYRVDGTTGEMSRFVTLPRASPSDDTNPFGVLGLGYDCETSNLYVSSVAGSNRHREIGRIYRVDPNRGTVEAQLDNVDPLGLAVFNTTTGKRLYYGLARQPEIWSVGLDGKGNFQSQPRLEISLAGLGPRGSDKARSIKFESGSPVMEVAGVEFSFNLIAPTEKQETVYHFNYDRLTDKWTQIVTAGQ